MNNEEKLILFNQLRDIREYVRNGYFPLRWGAGKELDDVISKLDVKGRKNDE